MGTIFVFIVEFLESEKRYATLSPTGSVIAAGWYIFKEGKSVQLHLFLPLVIYMKYYDEDYVIKGTSFFLVLLIVVKNISAFLTARLEDLNRRRVSWLFSIYL